ncbi:NAD(P)H-binding protein [Neorhizobium sp. CSC1952]|uniref:SDR family oxidoreductase n=1 Tax=Neorhizobium sp. CSC1952 TaxID=2978974 RepID=UPI0025A64972|nr:NAD(P)H-binding protein [Rhizobium sp. CSC1952]WJR66393.1 NAD(P)H-binding protein [Rhizobium sp. CSC1952]
MRTVVLGSSGLMGSRIVGALQRSGVEVVEASKSTGVDAITGEGLSQALAFADTLIDVTNFGSFGGNDALQSFKQAGSNLLTAARDAEIQHYIVLSVVGADQLVENDYFRAKLVQENLVRSSGVPYTIVRSTQFFETLGGIVDASEVDGALALPVVDLQPIAADEAAAIIARVGQQKAKYRTVDLGGPEASQLCDLARELLSAHQDNRAIVSSPTALYFGVALRGNALLPARPFASGTETFHDWLSRGLQT